MPAKPVNFGPRVCWFCGHRLTKTPVVDTDRAEHCPSPGCHWCVNCQTAKRQQATGR